MEDIGKIQAAGSFLEAMGKNLRRSKKAADESGFEKKLKEEEQKIQPTAQVVHPVARLHASMDYNKAKSQKKEYPLQVIHEEGNKVDTDA